MSDIDDLFKKHLKNPYAEAEAKPATPAIDAAKKDAGFFTDVLDKIQTFAGSGLNKASFGLADHAAALLNDKTVDEIRNRRQGLAKENPWTSTAGGFAGLAAQQIPVARGIGAVAAAAKGVAPIAGAVHRAVTGGSVGQGIVGQ